MNLNYGSVEYITLQDEDGLRLLLFVEEIQVRTNAADPVHTSGYYGKLVEDTGVRVGADRLDGTATRSL